MTFKSEDFGALHFDIDILVPADDWLYWGLFFPKFLICFMDCPGTKWDSTPIPPIFATGNDPVRLVSGDNYF